MPKVSICVPTYNYAGYISETIESALNQNYTDFELLIIDDCSKDNTAAVVAPYVHKDSRIRFVVNQANLGMVANWNSCLAQAKGEYVQFVFGDDLLASPDTIGRFVALLDSDDSISLVGSARNLIDESSQVKGIVSRFDTGVMNGTEVITYCLSNQMNYIGEPSVVMFRRAQALRGFNPSYKQYVDLEMWFHLLEQGTFAYINEPLCSFRIHEKQQSRVNEGNLAAIDDIFLLQSEYLHKKYISLTGIIKAYIKYNSLYDIWKLHNKGIISYIEAITMINFRYNYSYFRLCYPFYRMLKPLFKQYNKSAFKPHPTGKTK